jgi:heterokaryon incompatibility protein (HET)
VSIRVSGQFHSALYSTLIYGADFVMKTIVINSRDLYSMANFYKDCPVRWRAIRPRTSVTGYPILPNGTRWVQSMIQLCSSKHKLCPSAKESLLPKRTLSVRRLPDGETSVKIQENKERKGRYNALSHCWGSSQTCTTTSRMLEAYKNGIPWTKLPNTFRDAIIFSLDLGIDQIWIDALCIVQDDARDWDIESSKMADIYQNAFVTLAATTSSNGDGGCFSINHRPVREVELSDNRGLVGGSSITVRQKLKHWTFTVTNTSVQPYPLLSRGWVFQERYLSPRVLHFCKEEMVWECIEETTCECGGISKVRDPYERFLLAGKANVESNPKTRPAMLDKDKIVSSIKEVDPSPKACKLRATETDLRDKHAGSTNYSPSSSKLGRQMTRKLKGLKSRFLRSNAPREDRLRSSEIELGSASCSTKPAFARTVATNADTQMETETSETGQSVESSKQTISQAWHTIVEQYSVLKLSIETDRLPALSGLAMRASSLLGQYFCGLWSDTLRLDLLWRVPMLEQGSRRPAKYIGPSWSWVSVNGCVRYWQDLDQDLEENETIRRLESHSSNLDNWFERGEAEGYLLQIFPLKSILQKKADSLRLGCTVYPVGENSFGEVSSGSLEITGHLQSAKLRYMYYRSGFNSGLTHDPLKYQLVIDAFNLELSFFADYVLSEGPDRLPEGMALHLLLMHPYLCLVLRRKSSYQFERIGIVKVPGNVLFLYRLDWMLNSMQTDIEIV